MSELDRSVAQRALSFGSVAQLYDQYRPGVPDAFNEWLQLNNSYRVIDLAAGTGLATRTIERSGATVIAVEPDTAMLNQLRSRSPSIVAVAARAEALPFADQFADAAVIMSAWHWLDAQRIFAECARVLRDGAPLVIGWNGADQRVSWVKDLFTLRRSLEGETTNQHDARGVDVSLAVDFGEPESAILEWTWTRSREQLRQLFLTYSGVITLGEAPRERLFVEIDRRIDHVMNGELTVELPMSTRLWRASRRARSLVAR